MNKLKYKNKIMQGKTIWEWRENFELPKNTKKIQSSKKEEII